MLKVMSCYKYMCMIVVTYIVCENIWICCGGTTTTFAAEFLVLIDLSKREITLYVFVLFFFSFRFPSLLLWSIMILERQTSSLSCCSYLFKRAN